MSRIFQNWLSLNHASSGYIALIVVSSIHVRKTRSRIVSRVQGIFFGSRELRAPTSVTSATIMANGMSYANDQVNRCGFMNPIQVQTRMPIYGLQRITGSVAKMNTVSATSLIVLGAQSDVRAVPPKLNRL